MLKYFSAACVFCAALFFSLSSQAQILLQDARDDFVAEDQLYPDPTNKKGTALSFWLSLDPADATDVDVEILFFEDQTATEPLAIHEVIEGSPVQVLAGQTSHFRIRGLNSASQTGTQSSYVRLRVLGGDHQDEEFGFLLNNSDDKASNTDNQPPTKSALIEPAFEEQDVPLPVDFVFEYPYDPDGDALVLTLCVSENIDMSDPICRVADYPSSFVGSSLDAIHWEGGSFYSRSQIFVMFLLLSVVGSLLMPLKPVGLSGVLLFLSLLGSCAKHPLLEGFEIDPRDQVSLSFDGLNNSTDYFWRVYADDLMGNVSSSALGKFRTED